MSPAAGQQNASGSEDQLAQENVNDLARILASEARGLNETAQAMVGWTVVNRMKQRYLTQVSSVWTHGNYAHGHMLNPTSLRLAEGILNGTAMDISQGAQSFLLADIHAEGGRNTILPSRRERRNGERSRCDEKRPAGAELSSRLGKAYPLHSHPGHPGQRS